MEDLNLVIIIYEWFKHCLFYYGQLYHESKPVFNNQSHKTNQVDTLNTSSFKFTYFVSNLDDE